MHIQSCEVSNIHVQIAGECCVPNCTASRNKNLGKIIHGLSGCVYVYIILSAVKYGRTTAECGSM